MERKIAEQLGLKVGQVKGTLALLDEGNTVPFVARYRKEATGDLDEVQIRDVARVAQQLRALEERREAVLKSIGEQGKLTAQLEKDVRAAEDMARLEDLYAPYKQKRRTRAVKAIEAGLQPLADALERGEDPTVLAAKLVCEDFPTVEDVLGGAKDIIAEAVADDAYVRDFVRTRTRKDGALGCRKRRGAEEDPKYEIYYGFTSPLSRMKPHQVLAIRRGESEKVLSAGVEADADAIVSWIQKQRNPVKSGVAKGMIDEAIADGYARLLHPSIERDVRGELEEQADKHAIGVFSLNLKNLLLQPPLAEKRVMGVDPGMRTGCKIAIVDETGQLVATDHFYVHDGRKSYAPAQIAALAEKHNVDLIAVGNGTGSRETEEVVAESIRGKKGIQYLVVDEAGASVYSASDIAREEFPELDVSVRGAVSIARRVQDPLAELVKIDPKSIGVGMYQHDVNQVELMSSLDAVVEDVVNAVGVDLNSASQPLLARVAGIGPTLARRIVEQRNVAKRFNSREDVKKVRGLGAKTFEQCAGFLRIRDGKEPLDMTGIHPENYEIARAILKAAGAAVGDVTLPLKLKALQDKGTVAKLAAEHGVGELTLRDVIDALVRPGRDPREDLDKPILRSEVLTLDELKEGMRVKGTVRNVVDFGAFVDIGVKHDGLVHVSQMANKFVNDPYSVVSVGDKVDVVITSIDKTKGRIGLSMKM